MNRKLKNTLGLVGLLILILLGGGIFLFVIQKGQIEEREARVKDLKAKDYNSDELRIQYEELVNRSSSLDSILASRSFNIPANLSSIKFYDFINDVSSNFSPDTHVDIEFTESEPDKEFFFYQYNVTGGGDYNDLYKLMMAKKKAARK